MTKTSTTSFAAVTPFRLRHRRTALGLTQEALAGLIGVTPNTVARWERGERESRIPGAVDALLTQLEERQRQQAATSSAPTPEAPVAVDQAPAAQQPQPATTVQERAVAKAGVPSKSRVARPAGKGSKTKTSKPASSRRPPRGGGRAATAARRRRSSS